MSGFSMSPPRGAARPQSRPRRFGGVLLPLLTAGCALTASPAATATPQPHFTTPVGTVTSSAPVAAYRSYWTAVERAATHAAWQDPQLAQVATGPALHAVTQTLYGWRRAHRVARGHVDLRPTLLSMTATVAHLTDCQDSTGWALYVGRRRVSPPAAPRREVAAVTLTFTDGRWKVAGLRFDRTRSC